MGLNMKEFCDVFIESSEEPIVAAVSGGVDWRGLADKRLSRLVDLEHKYSMMLDRLSLLQIDYRESLEVGANQLQHIQELNRMHEQRLADLAHEHATMRAAYESMQASFLGSRSWRLTRPLRALSMWVAARRHRVA
jgi:hypothetical protein